MNYKSIFKVTPLAIIGLACFTSSYATGARADTGAYPYQGTQKFTTEGTVTLVDADRDRVTLKTAGGHVYTLDTDDTQIKLTTSTRPGDTADLMVGMHVSVSGRLLAQDIIAADSLSVMSIQPGSEPVDESPEPMPPTVEPAPQPAPETPVFSGNGQRIKLRGTVENVDDDRGLVIVRVNTHQRTIVVDHSTDLTDIHADDNHIGLHDGDRITVVGRLNPDGTVSASAVSLSRDIHAAIQSEGPVAMAPPVPMAPPVDGDQGNQIIGRVTQSADPLFSRDIRVRLDSGRSITVHVPHEARIMLGGAPISVHDLTGDEVVRVTGAFDGDDFKATRIDVLEIYRD